MQPRRIARVTSFGPDDLRLIFKAYDGAWSEIAPKVGTDPRAVEMARMTLASIVLGLATANTLAPDGLRAMAAMAFWAKRRIGGWERLAASITSPLSGSPMSSVTGRAVRIPKGEKAIGS
jgi:hypothetical protein